uniref:Uncharacterized protein n=1 Tax=Arundo donax TaxID=35708 RepID=A0A0A9ARE3_ARUDO
MFQPLFTMFYQNMVKHYSPTSILHTLSHPI